MTVNKHCQTDTRCAGAQKLHKLNCRAFEDKPPSGTGALPAIIDGVISETTR
jgi:hypothetical protein